MPEGSKATTIWEAEAGRAGLGSKVLKGQKREKSGWGGERVGETWSHCKRARCNLPIRKPFTFTAPVLAPTPLQIFLTR